MAGPHVLTGGVAWWAHVGGFLIGMMLMPVLGAIAPKDEPRRHYDVEW
jgi:membrane associated rhomboid family serine protease